MRSLKYFLIFIILITLAGCSTKVIEKEEVKTVKVLYWDQNMFMDMYGNYLTFEFPDINFDVVPLKQIYAEGDPLLELKNIMEQEDFDLTVLQMNQYEQLLKDNAFQALDSVFRVDKDFLNQQVYQALQNEGILYGISPYFTADLLYINKDAFSQAKVAVPDKLFWEDFFSIASMFSLDINNMSALAFEGATPWSLVLRFGVVQGLRFYDSSNNSVILNTQEWGRVAKQVADLIKTKSIQVDGVLNPLEGDAFSQGKAAMTLQTDSYRNTLTGNKQVDFEWGVVPLPTGTNTSSYPSVSIEQVFSVPKSSNQQAVVERILTFLLSEKFSKVIIQKGLLSTRINENNIDANLHYLYADNDTMQLKTYSEVVSQIPEEKLNAIISIGEEKYTKAIHDHLEFENILYEIEAQLNQ